MSRLVKTKKQIKIFSLILTVVISCAFVFAQSGKNSGSLPKGYGGIELGMSVDSVKDALKKNSEFGYNGDRDVSLLPGENRVLIETDARDFARWSFLEQCWFQFYNEKLYIITMNINTQKMDYYTMFKNFTEKYGEPDEINPEKAVWESDSVTMILEKPLSVKYIDTQVYKNILELSNIEISGEEWTREMFLEEF